MSEQRFQPLARGLRRFQATIGLGVARFTGHQNGDASLRLDYAKCFFVLVIVTQVEA